MRTLYRAAAVHAPDRRTPGTPGTSGGPAPTALVVADGAVAWIGDPDDAAVGEVDATVDLPGTLITPAFVDAHAHVTETGLLLRGVDLQQSRSVTEILDAVTAAARGGGPVLGHGWDETRLAEGRAPTAAELDRAAGETVVYLSRVDVHSAVISSTLARTSGAADLDGWDGAGRVERDAHHAARAATRSRLTPSARRDAQLAALHAAAGAGIAALHEMSAPHIAPEEDLRDLVALVGSRREGVDGPAFPDVVAYRGQLVADVGEARAVVARLGVPVAGLAGDLCVDGSVGSRTAAWREPYRDGAQARGHLYLTVEQIRDHVAACTRAGLQAGFHVIGDAAVEAALRGVRRAAEQVGIAAVRAARHRLEHLEAIDHDGLLDLADLGVTASVQPAFDALWGGDAGMYAARLGADRALAMNPLGALAAVGVPVALGSDSPVTPFDPWGAVRAWARHHAPEQRVDVTTALTAHTVGGWRAGGGAAGAGRLEVGAPATFAAWDLGAAVAGRPGLEHPAFLAFLDGDGPSPRCVLTVGAGRTLHDAASAVTT